MNYLVEGLSPEELRNVQAGNVGCESLYCGKLYLCPELGCGSFYCEEYWPFPE